MKKIPLKLITLVLSMAGISLLLSSIAFAQSQTPTPTPEQAKVVDLAPWLTADQPDYKRGGLLAAGGILGALVTTFGLIGGVFPGTAGKAEIDADAERLKTLSERLVELVAAEGADADKIRAVEKSVNNLRDDLRSERWRQFAVASIFYVALGAAIAALLASNLLQAIVIGAGWTGLVGSLGLKSDYAKRKAVKDSALEETVNLLKATPANLPLMKLIPHAGGQFKIASTNDADRVTTDRADVDRIDELERKVRIAKAL
jgi:hypothetical protein